jgi:hypothetical protein
MAITGDGDITMDPFRTEAGKFVYPVGVNTPLIVVEYIPMFFNRTHVPESNVDGVRSTTVSDTEGFKSNVLN